uniref:Ig-like domain-containing protein n=1 Tax=Sander lucioperca TaxID=283035 RepID=A0A8D0ATV6_SANLU
TMKQSLITALILCWISVSSSESHTETVEGRPGGEVTLTCSNPSSRDAATLWLRVVNRTKASFISAMFSSTVKPFYSDGIQNGRFNMSTNISTLFLQIKHVDVSDSGLYLCGFYIGGPFHFNAIHLNVKAKLMSLILGALTVLLLMIIIGLNLDSDLKDAALSLYAATIRNRRPASEREVETHAVYAVCR